MIATPEELDMVLYKTRLLVFLETVPQSNKYKQVILRREEFTRVSLSIGVVTKKGINGAPNNVLINMSEEVYPLPDLQEHLPCQKPE